MKDNPKVSLICAQHISYPQFFRWFFEYVETEEIKDGKISSGFFLVDVGDILQSKTFYKDEQDALKAFHNSEIEFSFEYEHQDARCSNMTNKKTPASVVVARVAAKSK